MSNHINHSLEAVKPSETNQEFTGFWCTKSTYSRRGLVHFKNADGYEGSVWVPEGSENMNAIQLLFSAQCGIGFVMKMAGISFSEYLQFEKDGKF